MERHGTVQGQDGQRMEFTWPVVAGRWQCLVLGNIGTYSTWTVWAHCYVARH